MKHQLEFLAADLGASSGRMMLGSWNGSQFGMKELHRFPNGGVEAEKGLYWDVLGLWGNLQDALAKYRQLSSASPAGVGIDAWGVDFALLDRHGRLVGNPFHYRDHRTAGMPARLFLSIPESRVFIETGTQTMEFNTLFQLYSMVQSQDEQLATADKLLMIPDLFLYFLSGEISVEHTAASTTQVYCLAEHRWATDLLNDAGIKASLFPKVICSGTVVSPVKTEVLQRCGFDKPFPAIAVASHDTASAVAAIPCMDEASVFISCGTWSIVGVETTHPNLSDDAMRLGFTNEGSADGSVQLLKNIAGLWTLQECARHWRSCGSDHPWNDIVQAASSAPALRSIFDPNDVRLQAASDMPGAIATYCANTNQRSPETIGETARSIFESLCLKYRSTIEALEALTHRTICTVRIVGGGAQNALLCQMIADSCRRAVVAGPVEASALGNVMLQAMATGHVHSVHAGREAIAQSIRCSYFEPGRSDRWDEAYGKFKCLETV